MRSKIFFQSGKSPIISLFLLSGLLAACTASRPPALDRARADYQQAANDPAVRSGAAADLSAAENLLQQAEKSWKEDEDYDETVHLSYLASLNTSLARANAEHAAADKAFEQLNDEKNQVRLQARDAEIAKLKAKKVPQGILVTLGDRKSVV